MARCVQIDSLWSVLTTTCADHARSPGKRGINPPPLDHGRITRPHGDSRVHVFTQATREGVPAVIATAPKCSVASVSGEAMGPVNARFGTDWAAPISLYP